MLYNAHIYKTALWNITELWRNKMKPNNVKKWTD